MIKIAQLITIGIVITFVAGCTTRPALHVIGVYEGKTPPGVDDRPWWAECNDDKNDSQPSVVSPSSIGCHKIYAGQKAEKEVAVSVNDDSRPIVLALTAYEKTHWKVSIAEGVKLKKIILGGYHSQRVSGIPTETSIETYTYDPSSCERCLQSDKYFYSYEAPPKQLKEITGLEVTSFQGRYNGSEFAIVPRIKNIK